MEWTAEAIERLRGLWAEGHSTAEIGRRMGISKNAVVGKAHRLNLSARPSPIRREELRRGEAVIASRPVVAAEPRPPALPRPVPVPRPVAPPSVPRIVAAAPPPRVPPAPVSLPVVRPFQRSSTRECCWPIGEPGTSGFRFCSGTATSGRPYCAEHASIAYVKVRDRREDAA